MMVRMTASSGLRHMDAAENYYFVLKKSIKFVNLLI